MTEKETLYDNHYFTPFQQVSWDDVEITRDDIIRELIKDDEYDVPKPFPDYIWKTLCLYNHRVEVDVLPMGSNNGGSYVDVVTFKESIIRKTDYDVDTLKESIIKNLTEYVCIRFYNVEKSRSGKYELRDYIEDILTNGL